MTAKRKAVSFLVLTLMLSLFVAVGAAQTTTSILEGKVTDSTGAVVPGASVEVKGATVTRNLVTDSEGHYRAVALPAGAYTVSVAKPGFNTQVLQRVKLLLDRTVNLDVRMEVAPRSESVTVTAQVPLVDTTSASTGQVIENSVIDSIPLNGRNYLDLIQLLPGVANNANASFGGAAKDATGSILGERAGNATYLIDGLENNDDFHGGVLQAFTQDAIQEFEVIQAGYKAEFGRGSGGVINVITKSGTNSLHGSGFLFHRNDTFDSSNVTNEPPPKLKRYNYGGTLGGPIRKDKDWFYGSIEEMQETRGSIYPPDIPPSLLANEDFSRHPKTNDLRVFGKYNQQINKQHDFRAELSWTRSKLENVLASPSALPSASLNNQTNTFLGKVSLTTIFSPRMFLDSSFGVRDQNFEQNQGTAFALSYGVVFLDDGTSYDFGPPIGSVQSLNQRYYTGREVLSFYAGKKHSAKVGFEYIRTAVDGNNSVGALQSVIVTLRPWFEQFGVDSFQIPQGVAFLNPGDNLSKLRNNGISLFGQDDWKVAEKLTLNLGVRWDYDSRFDATRNFAPRLGLIFSPDKKTVFQASFGMFYDRYRIGIAQPIPELGGFNGQTVTYLDYPRLTADNLIPFPGSLTYLSMVAGDPTFINTHYDIPVGALVTSSTVQSLTGMTADQFLASLDQYLATFGTPYTPIGWDPLTGYLSQDITGNFVDQIRVARPFRTPYNNTFTVGVQRELPGNVAVGATYVKRSIRNILGVRITNLSPEARNIGAPTTTDGKPIQRSYGPWYSGKYDALMVTFNKRFGHRFQLMSSYTYARATDNLLHSSLGIGIAEQGGASMPSDNLNLELDRGNSDLLVPHSFVSSGLVELPLGMRFSGVFRLTSGVYFSAFGTPEDIDGDGIFSTRVPGTKRNQFRGPMTNNLDLRLEKRFTFGERFGTSVLAEVFNLTNARNPSVIENAYVDGVPRSDFGKTRTPLPGREAQFGLKFEF
ncbi:MAG: TonB-dependent receptor domain-containing protein [Terriglobales bacterium]